jgi:hypothetical protein
MSDTLREQIAEVIDEVVESAVVIAWGNACAAVLHDLALAGSGEVGVDETIKALQVHTPIDTDRILALIDGAGEPELGIAVDNEPREHVECGECGGHGEHDRIIGESRAGLGGISPIIRTRECEECDGTGSQGCTECGERPAFRTDADPLCAECSEGVDAGEYRTGDSG